MISKQLILFCLIIWTVAKACENPALKNGAESNSTESSRQKRSCLDVNSSCKYCEGTLTFIPNIQGRRKIFE